MPAAPAANDGASPQTDLQAADLTDLQGLRRTPPDGTRPRNRSRADGKEGVATSRGSTPRPSARPAARDGRASRLRRRRACGRRQRERSALMAVIHLSERERQWLLRQARASGPEWWRAALEREDRAARGFQVDEQGHARTPDGLVHTAR